MTIKLLNKTVIDKIAAGEVIVNGAGVVKELIENSIDANSRNITVFIENGGKSLIKIVDDGSGIDHNEIELAFMRNATSKIMSDLDAIHTLGFRGEALASISAISKVEIITRTATTDYALCATIQDGMVVDKKEVGAKVGTSISVKDLFYNVPVRHKFLRKSSQENADIIQTVSSLALSRPDLAFSLFIDKKNILFTTGSNNVKKLLKEVYGSDILNGLIELKFEDSPLYMNMYLTSVNFIRSQDDTKLTFLNGRSISSKLIQNAIDSVYTELYSKKSGNYFVYMSLPVDMIDVNVHPSKLDVKFLNESLIGLLIKQGIRDALNETFVINSSVFDELNSYKQTSSTSEENNAEIELVEDDLIRRDNSSADVNSLADEATLYVQTENVIYKNNKTPQNSATISNFNSIISEPVAELYKPKVKNEQQSFLQSVDKNKIDRNTIEQISHMKFMGNAFGIFSLFESDDSLYAVDTHAAHERILYEKFLEQYNRRQVHIQNLLVPLMLNYNKYDRRVIMDNIEVFSSIGFDIDEYGDDILALRTIPDFLYQSELKDYLDLCIVTLSQMGTKAEFRLRSESLIKKACHSAIRGDEDISEDEARALLKSLSELTQPFTCPHGRPTIGKLSKQTFMKVFERI